MDLNKILKIIGFGFIVWIIPTIVTYLAPFIGALSFFDLFAAVSIAVGVVVASYFYFEGITVHFIREGITIAILWLAITLVLDMLLIFLGISEANLIEYAVTILPLYVIIPAITVGFGLYLDQMASNV